MGACQYEGRYRAAAELYAEIIASDARLADDQQNRLRFLATCSAALAGSGRDRDARGLDESGRLHWRKQARDWLRSDLALFRKPFKSNTGRDRESLEATLSDWLTEPDLACLRDPQSCKELLPSEQKEFQALCEDVRALIAETKK